MNDYTYTTAAILIVSGCVLAALGVGVLLNVRRTVEQDQPTGHQAEISTALIAAGQECLDHAEAAFNAKTPREIDEHRQHYNEAADRRNALADEWNAIHDGKPWGKWEHMLLMRNNRLMIDSATLIDLSSTRALLDTGR